MTRSVLLIASLDTKAEQARLVRDRLRALQLEVLVMDTTIRGTHTEQVTWTNAEVAAAAGTDLAAVRNIGHEGQALRAMTEGAVVLARAAFDAGRFQGAFGLGGTMGSTLASAVMRALPLGVPKVVVSTMASGYTKPFIGNRDIVLFPSVVDLSGTNRLLTAVLGNAAHAFAGMVQGYAPIPTAARPLILVSTLGTTDACTVRVRQALETDGYEVMVFHTNGTGGQTMEELMHELPIAAVADLSLVEVSDHVFGGLFDAGPVRGTTALELGIPTVFAPGNIDFVVGGPIEDAERRFPNRRYHRHNASVTAVRVSHADLGIIAAKLAAQWNGARAPIRALVPLGGFSSHDSPQGHLYEPTAPPVFADALRAALDPRISLATHPWHINDPRFADAVVDAVRELVGR